MADHRAPLRVVVISNLNCAVLRIAEPEIVVQPHKLTRLVAPYVNRCICCAQSNRAVDLHFAGDVKSAVDLQIVPQPDHPTARCSRPA